jgi:hypothetical protein
LLLEFAGSKALLFNPLNSIEVKQMAAKKEKIQHDDIDRMPFDAQKSDRYALLQNGQEVFRGTHADCYTALIKRQPRSSAYALRFGGWECKHISELA